ncbi:LAO/AO transport system kinase [Halorubrum alkaliphilum]|uniref:LAO/AO transport system kinase n=1 Tax=Halorubrum alkaliphilum TaxID=261290 RepID=A0A8T4GH21_9EURY|nr:methylmalonyl Co-A mutase-associated GTPase MeaB [Halorubrum alkaliphilum]MBP1922345.1 LAO/AO transport system kinase [Halorubrum alkaliphilum]
MDGHDGDADTSATTAELRDVDAELVADLLDGSHRALARVITRIENRSPGYRGIVGALHEHTGGADVIGVTGAPGAGKSTLVDKLAAAYRERGDTVGVVAVDPSSPYTGGALLGDRIRMASNVGDMDVFFRSMSARGQLGGLSMATADAVKALDAFGKDTVIIETVGAGQNEVDIVRTADTVAVLVQPGSGDDVQTLKAGILEIGDVFVVNKADMDGADRTLAELEEMVHRRESPTKGLDTGHHGFETPDGPDDTDAETDSEANADRPTEWTPDVLGTVAKTGEGVEALIDAFDAHAQYLRESGTLDRTQRERYAEEIRTLVRSDIGSLATAAIDRRGGIDTLAERVRRRETDPYSVAAAIVDPIASCAGDDDETVTGKRDDAATDDRGIGRDDE